jgi:hypothetical protein
MPNPVIRFDESHGESWTLSVQLATRISKTSPESRYYGHLAQILRDTWDADVAPICNSWQSDSLDGVDLLILAHPSFQPPESGIMGSPTFSANDIQLLIQNIERGMALFIINEYGNSQWGSNLNEIGVHFGITFNDDTLYSDDRSQGFLTRHFTCQAVPGDDLFANHKISYHRGGSLNLERPATERFVAPLGEVVLATSSMGSGRVAAVADSDFLAVPFISQVDNAEVFLSLCAWLVDRLPGGIEQSFCHNLGHLSPKIVTIPNERNIKRASGAPIVDVSDVEELMRSLNQEGADSLSDPYNQSELFLRDSAIAFQELPRSIRRSLLNFRRDSNLFGGILVRGIPLDRELGATPADSRRSLEKRTSLSEFWLTAFGSALGDVASYAQEKDGELIHQVCPVEQNATLLSSESSSILLDFHTETAFHPFMPDYVLLLCLRPDHDHAAKTTIASTRMAVPLVPIKYRSVLFEDLFRTGIDYSFGSVSGTKANGPVMPVLYGSPYDPFMRFDLDLMVGITPEAEVALEHLKLAIREVACFVTLEPGDLFVIDNRRAVHARSEFIPRYDGQDRWLQRVYVMQSLATSEESRHNNERIIEVLFQN